MNRQAIELELRQAFPGAALEVRSNGNRLAVDLVWSGFAGMSRVKRQQAVYAVLKLRIQSGEIHAIEISAKTAEEI